MLSVGIERIQEMKANSIDLIFMVFPRDQFKETMKQTYVLDSFILKAKINEGFQRCMQP
jgi:hypothetical protein